MAIEFNQFQYQQLAEPVFVPSVKLDWLVQESYRQNRRRPQFPDFASGRPDDEGVAVPYAFAATWAAIPPTYFPRKRNFQLLVMRSSPVKSIGVPVNAVDPWEKIIDDSNWQFARDVNQATWEKIIDDSNWRFRQ